jgi:3-methyladenine DNA glycosylase/8-oxoguanine DNA glycosylase
VRGVGPWTASCLAAQTWGDRDAVVVGDSGIPSIVGWPPAREERADDDRMIALLEPHRPHRYRVLRLAMAAGDGGWGWRLASTHPDGRLGGGAPTSAATDRRRSSEQLSRS